MRILIALLCILAFTSAKSQLFYISDIDTSNYPTMRANFYAWDQNWARLRNFNPNDFQILENGQQCQLQSVNCPEPQSPDILSTVIMIDVSGSMGSYWGIGNPEPLELAKTAARGWVAGMPDGKGEVAICSFNGYNYFNQDFTTNKRLLFEAIDSLTADGLTDFDAALIDSLAGAILVARERQHRRVVILITDGYASGNENEILDQALAGNVTIYTVTLGIKCPDILRNVSIQSGGMFYENITTMKQARIVYEQLLAENYDNRPCTVEWRARPYCAPMVDLEIDYMPISAPAQANYIIPEDHIANLIVDPLSLRFGGVPPGNTKDTTIEVTAENADIEITDIISSNSYFNISPKSFLLPAGESKTFNVTYTPVDSAFNFTTFEFITDLCPASLYVTGGYLGVLPKKKTLKLTHPNGGEAFLAGSDTLVTWEGLPPDEPVHLEYSIDSGGSWTTLADSARNLNYRWENIPLPTSDECLMRVSQYYREYLPWDTTIATTSGYSLEWSPDSQILAWGSGNGLFRLYNIPECERKKNDYYQDIGTVELEWRPNTDTIAIAFTHSGNGKPREIILYDYGEETYVDTFYLSYNRINDIDWSPDGSLLAVGSNDSLVTIVSHDGNIVHSFRPVSVNPFYVQWNPVNDLIAISYNRKMIIIESATGNQVAEYEFDNYTYVPRWSPDGTRIAIGSNLSGYEIIDTQSGERKVICDTSRFVYNFAWSPDGQRLAVASYGRTSIINPDTGELLRVIDEYISSAFSDFEWSPDGRLLAGTTKDGIEIWDMYIPILQSDSSDAEWAIVEPLLEGRNVDMGSQYLGKSNTKVFQAFLQNPGAYPSRVDSITITGPQAEYFDIIPGYLPVTLPAGGQAPVEFTFTPEVLGIVNADLNIHHPLGELNYNIQGIGLQTVLLSDYEAGSNPLDFGLVEILHHKDTTEIMVENSSTQTVTVDSLKMLGPDFHQFEVLSPLPPYVLSAGRGQAIQIRFSPIRPGKTSGRIGFYYDGGRMVVANIFGRGISADLMAHDDSARAGDKINIKVDLKDTKPIDLHGAVNNFELLLSVDKTVLAPLDKAMITQSDNERTIIKYIGFLDPCAEHLAEIPCIAGLGKTEYSDIIIEDITFYNSHGELMDFDIDYINAKFHLLDICPDGGKRLINPNSHAAFRQLSPNPANGSVSAEFELSENGPTEILITNNLGQLIRSLPVSPRIGTNTVIFTTGDMPAGQYFVQLRTPTVIDVRILIVR